MTLRALISSVQSTICSLTSEMAETVAYTTEAGTLGITGVWSNEAESAEQNIGNGSAKFHGLASIMVSVKELPTPDDGAVVVRTLPDGSTERWNITEIVPHGSWGWKLILRAPQSTGRVPGRRLR